MISGEIFCVLGLTTLKPNRTKQIPTANEQLPYYQLFICDQISGLIVSHCSLIWCEIVAGLPVVGRAENLVVVHDLRLVTAGDGVEQVEVRATEAPLQHVRTDRPCHVRTLDALSVVAYDRLLCSVEVSPFHPALVQYRTMLPIWHTLHFTFTYNVHHQLNNTAKLSDNQNV